MHGLRGNGAREKTALMPDPLWRSSFRFTTLDARRGYGHGAPKEGHIWGHPLWAYSKKVCSYFCSPRSQRYIYANITDICTFSDK